MSPDPDENRFLQCFRDAMDGLNGLPIDLQTPLTALPNWDSLAILKVIDFAEAEFQVNLSGSDLHRCQCVGDIFQLISARQRA